MTVKDLHRKAMEYNDEAIIAKSKGDDPKSLYLKAFEFEKQAYLLFSSKSDEEPTRSVLLRSTASLAMMAGLNAEAEKLISLAISGNPPEEILEELNELQNTNIIKLQKIKEIGGFGMNQELRMIMSRNPVTASPDLSIDEVSKLMMDEQLQQLPVVLDGKLLGVITAYDLWQSMRSGHGHDRKVKDLMKTQIVRLTPKDKIGTAAELFADIRFKILPVVNLDNELKGIVTVFDVMRCVFNEEYPQPVLSLASATLPK